MNKFILVGLSLMFIYVMPSNVVFIIALCAVNYRQPKILIPLIIGCAVATLLYLPLLPGMLADPQLRAHGSQLRNITGSMPEFFNAFVSYRWVLVPPVVVGCATGFPRKVLPNLLLIGFSLFPFALCGSYLWARVLFPLCIPLTLIAAHGLQSFVIIPRIPNTR